MKRLLPHISRIFSASLWSLLFALIGYNIFLVAITKPLGYSDNISQIFIHPFSAPMHENLAQTLWDAGNRTLATQEFVLVSELSPVLGASTTAKIQQETTNMIYWQHIVSAHPDYRDAYLQLAQLSYQNGNLIQTQAYLLKAQALDPNNTTVNRLIAFTSKLLE
jgi:tetratricopeptide (TPR) repeat protein